MKGTLSQLKRALLLTFWAALLCACSQSATSQPSQPEPSEDAPPPIALQLYTLRDYGTLDDKLSLAAEVGYAGVELYTTYDLDARALAQKVASHGLEITSQHVNLSDLRYHLDDVVTYARALGIGTVILPWLDDEERPESAAAWAALGQELGAYGQRLADEGITLGYHNHAFEMAEVEGKPALEWLFEGASVGVLKWQPDVAWIRLGGRDPAALIAAHRERVISMHAKDVAPDDEGSFADVGYGTLDWSAILAAAADTPLAWYIVEHDHPGDPVQNVIRSFDFLEAALRGAGE